MYILFKCIVGNFPGKFPLETVNKANQDGEVRKSQQDQPDQSAAYTR